MLARALDAGVPAGWVAGDEVYGNDPALRAGWRLVVWAICWPWPAITSGAPRHRPSVFDLQPDDLSTAGHARQRSLDVIGPTVSVASRSPTATTCRMDFTIHVP